MPTSARRIVRGDRRPRRRFRRAGGGDAVDHAGLARRPAASRGRSSCGCSWRGPATAGGSCPAASCASPTTPTRAPSACSTAGAPADAWVLSDKPVAETTLLPTPDRIDDHARDRRAAEPRRRQSVLGRPLCRARRGDAAPGAGAAQPRRPRATRPALDVIARICALLGGLGARCRTTCLNAKPALVARRRCSAATSTGALPYLVGAAQSAASVIRDRFSPDAWRALTDLVELINAPLDRGPTESAMIERVNGALAHHRVVLRAGAGKHEPARRLALPRARPPHRARDRNLPLRRVSSRSPPSSTARSTCCWSSPTARSPTGCATSWWRRARR